MAVKPKAASLPFVGVSEGLDLMKKVWGVTGLPTPLSVAQFATRLPQTLPSMIAPTLDVEELDKRIADLRAVEQWLNLNLSMLRTTVQSLEVQRNTIATLKSFGGAVLPGTAPVPAPAPNWPYPPVPAMPTASLPTMPLAPPAPVPAPAPPTRRRRRKAAADSAASPVLPLNPTAWWNTLQDQFARIAAVAAAEAQAAAKAAAKDAAAKEAPPKAAETEGKAGAAAKKGAARGAKRAVRKPPQR